MQKTIYTYIYIHVYHAERNISHISNQQFILYGETKINSLTCNMEILLYQAKPFLGFGIPTDRIHLCSWWGHITRTGNRKTWLFPNWGLRAGVPFSILERYIPKGERQKWLVSYWGGRLLPLTGPCGRAS